MQLLSNAHTHTHYCDGKDSPEAMILAALEKGFVSLGFSIHGWTPYELVPVTLEREAAYRAELQRLRAVYGDRIEILIGAERDGLYERDFSPYEYLIESTHWFRDGGEMFCVDSSAARTAQAIRGHFGGDAYAYCRAYFRQVAACCARSRADFIGHFDLVCKFNQREPLFDEADPRYLGPALEALDCALERGLPFEINSGPVGRGYRSAPYPAPALLRRIRERGGEIIINSDAHAVAQLDCAFEFCAQLARDCGFDHVLRLRRSGFEEVPLAP